LALPFGDGDGSGFQATKRAAESIPPPSFVDWGRRSGGRRDVVAVFLCAGLAGPAARLRSLFGFRLHVGRTDRGRKNAERDPLLAFVLVALFAFLLASAVGTSLAVAAITTLESVATFEPVTSAFAIAAWPLTSIVAIIVGRFILGDQLFVALELFLIFAARAALGLLLLEARTIILEHSKIMVGVLQIIFGLDAVAGELRVARQALVFLEQLRRIAALPVILTIAARTARHSLRTLSAAATTTAALTIVDQILVSLSHWRRFHRSPLFFPSTESVAPVAVDRPAHARKPTLPLPSDAIAKARRCRRRSVAGAHHF
jgi:hypothetical protein